MSAKPGSKGGECCAVHEGTHAEGRSASDDAPAARYAGTACSTAAQGDSLSGAPDSVHTRISAARQFDLMLPSHLTPQITLAGGEMRIHLPHVEPEQLPADWPARLQAYLDIHYPGLCITNAAAWKGSVHIRVELAWATKEHSAMASSSQCNCSGHAESNLHGQKASEKGIDAMAALLHAALQGLSTFDPQAMLHHLLSQENATKESPETEMESRGLSESVLEGARLELWGPGPLDASMQYAAWGMNGTQASTDLPAACIALAVTPRVLRYRPALQVAGSVYLK